MSMHGRNLTPHRILNLRCPAERKWLLIDQIWLIWSCLWNYNTYLLRKNEDEKQIPESTKGAVLTKMQIAYLLWHGELKFNGIVFAWILWIPIASDLRDLKHKVCRGTCWLISRESSSQVNQMESLKSILFL